MPKKARVFSQAFKLAAVRRMLADEPASALARELKVLRKDLYIWRDRYLSGGAEALRGRGRPPKGRGRAAEATPDAELEAARERVVQTELARKASPAAELEAARRHIAELERKVGQQQLDLDFFQRALRHVRESRRRSTKLGVTGSSRSSKR